MRISRRFRALALLVGLAAAGACLDDSVTGTRTVALTLSADPAAPVAGETVTFTVSGQGTNVTAILVEFGDGVADTLTYPAAEEIDDFTEHSYASAGTYTAVGTIFAMNGRLSDEVAVTVSEPTGN